MNAVQAKSKRTAEERAISREKRQWHIQGKIESNLMEDAKRREAEAEELELNRAKSEQLRTVS
jgi:hypothetical protein